MKRLRFILIIAAIALIFVPYSYASSLRAATDPAVKTITRTMDLPQSTQTSVFKVAGNSITILDFVGEVATLIQTQTTYIDIVADPTTPATDTNLCSMLDISADAVGTYYSLITSITTALAEYTNGVGATMRGVFGVTVPVGNIDVSTSASSTGAIKWKMTYRPYPGAKVTAE